MHEGSAQRCDHEALEAFVFDVLESAGLAHSLAELLTEALVTASLRGVDSHGIFRLDEYVANVENGGINPDPEITTTALTNSAFVVDGDDGPGHAATVRAMDLAIDEAKRSGIAFCTVKNSSHFGTGAFYTQRAAAADCIGVVMSNAGSNVIPFGGTDAYFGTNPLAYSIPTGDDVPITLDMATSQVAKAKLKVARRQQTEIPPNWAVDDDGQPTTDPFEATALQPLGGPKGYGLGLFVDVCAGLLTGMGSSPSVDSLSDDFTAPQRIGHAVWALDVEKFVSIERFISWIDEMIDELHAIPPKEETKSVKVPGEIEATTRTERMKNGIPVHAELIDRLAQLGSLYEIQIPADLQS